MLGNQTHFVTGLCELNFTLLRTKIITQKEYDSLWDYIHDNKPNVSSTGYYWPQREIKPRIEWLNKHIKKL